MDENPAGDCRVALQPDRPSWLPVVDGRHSELEVSLPVRYARRNGIRGTIMARTVGTFILIAVLAALLMALSIAVTRHGDPFGALGMRRLDSLAGAATFIPLASLYFLGVALLMILPLRAASFVLVNGVETVHLAAILLFATIVGCVVARMAFGQVGAYRALLDWQFV